MLPTKFKVAMFNHLGAAPFEDVSHEITAPARDWLIIERRQKVLFISQGNICSEGSDCVSGKRAPSGLCPSATLAAYHIWSDESGSEASFMLSSLAPRIDAHEGTFAPSCGVVNLSWVGGKIQLTAQGHDYCHRAFDAQTEGSSILQDPRNDLSLGCETALNRRWSFMAQHRAWAGESQAKPAVHSNSKHA